MHTTILPHNTNTFFPLNQRTKSTQYPPSPTTTTTFTSHKRSTTTHHHTRHWNIDLLHQQRDWLAKPVAPWHPLHPRTHRPSPTRLPKHMAPPPQKPQPIKLPPPTSTHDPSHHRHIHTLHRFHPLLVVIIPPRHVDTCSLHCHRSLTQIYTRHHQRTNQRHLLRRHRIRLQHGHVLQETFTNTLLILTNSAQPSHDQPPPRP